MHWSKYCCYKWALSHCLRKLKWKNRETNQDNYMDSDIVLSRVVLVVVSGNEKFVLLFNLIETCKRANLRTKKKNKIHSRRKTFPEQKQKEKKAEKSKCLSWICIIVQSATENVVFDFLNLLSSAIGKLWKC